MKPSQRQYREGYLTSPHWIRFRKQYLAEHPYCESKYGCRYRATEIHHLFYKDWRGNSVRFREDFVPGCVVAVCRTCHYKYEQEKRRKKFWNRVMENIYSLMYELWKRMW